ncbi:MAG: YceI family protein [Sphingobacteriales bacterium]|nr:MAG: YceI family protein [Sphingobacteriales bacterium]
MATYTIDPTHSEVSFKVKHLMISTVTGSFEQFDAKMSAEKENFTDAQISFEADIESISTNNTQRDQHLKSPDFFDSENHPKMTFVSTSLVQKSDTDYLLNGDLTIRGVTKPVSLAVEYAGKMTDFYGNEKHGFEINGKLSRKEFGLQWNAVTEAGGVVVSDEVKLSVNVQFQKN